MYGFPLVFFKHHRSFIIMNFHDATPKNIPNIFPIFFLLYEKKIHVKNSGLKS